MKPLTIALLAAIGLATAACGSSPASPGTAASSATSAATATPSSAQPTASASSQPTVAPSSSSPAPPPSVAACLSRYLHGSTGLSQGAAGSIYVVITFKNLNNVPCTLYGFPGVALAAGTPVTDIGQPSVESTSTSRELVTLRPGRYASATLRVVNAGIFPASSCKPKKSTWLAVIPPNQTVPLYIPYQSTACAGSTKLLTVTAVRPGTGG